MADSNKKSKILIVGGGFAGIKAALELEACGKCNITLISDHTHFRYYPAVYRAATGGKRHGTHIRINNIIGGSNIRFVRGVAAHLDRKNRQLTTDDKQKFSYDKLILALGSVTNYFGIKGLREHSFGLKTYEEVRKLKNHLHEQFVKNSCPDSNYIIVGGGPTGIELAGTLPAYLRDIAKRHEVGNCKLNITLLEAAPRLLPRSPQKISRAVTKRLRKLGVKVLCGQKVEGQTAEALMVNGKPLHSRTVVWTAGVTNHPFFKNNDFSLNERGKVNVDEFLQAEPETFVIGDNANTPYSGLAQTALYDGEFVARNIIREMDGDTPQPYTPKKPITVMPVGPRWATVEWGNRRFMGLIGWILRPRADFAAFKELGSWPKAGKQWLTTISDEGLDCPNCWY